MSKKDKTTEQDSSELEQAKAEIEDLTDTLKRVQAEYINYKNRSEKEMQQVRDYANAQLIKELLPILDSFELALKNTKDLHKFKDGVEMVYAQLMETLKQQGLTVVDAEEYDPYKHEVLMKVDSEEEEDTILEVLQKGYMLKDKIIRHANVKVSR